MTRVASSGGPDQLGVREVSGSVVCGEDELEAQVAVGQPGFKCRCYCEAD
jgi:hypothetical protein